jgi:uncharacterized phosphosugar-binding protein
MSAQQYYEKITEVLTRIHLTQMERIRDAAQRMASSIAEDGRVYIFGSGHSVIPVLDIFPRYGSFVGFFPLYDPRLMWFNVVGPGGARELLWLERTEGYARVFLQSYPLEPGDCILVFSHGGLNAAPVDVALEAKAKGLTVISVSSISNQQVSETTHSSGKQLPDVADIPIDNCVPPEDALVEIGRRENVAAGSTIAAVFISMALVAEVGALLNERGIHPPTFVSPNVSGIEKDHNQKVFEAFTSQLFSRRP